MLSLVLWAGLRSHFNLLFVNIRGVLLLLTLFFRGLQLRLPELFRLVLGLVLARLVVNERLLVLGHLGVLLVKFALLGEVIDGFLLLFITKAAGTSHIASQH